MRELTPSMRWFRRWRLARLLHRHRIPAGLWCRVVSDVSLLQRYDRLERHRLRVLSSLFLHRKVLNGAGGLRLDDYMQTVIAAQACTLILYLGLEFYDGWTEIIVYPDSFGVHDSYPDEDGVVHEADEWRSGEAWEQGPLVLAWAEIDPAGEFSRHPGTNVVVHEFAHKLDQLNGASDGFPPLHRGMDNVQWSTVFTRIYNELNEKLNLWHEVHVDPYAASSPAEFFAVMSEYFFADPAYLGEIYPDLYRLLSGFYRQNPARVAFNDETTPPPR